MITYTLKEDFALIRVATGDQVKMPAGAVFNLVLKREGFSLLRHQAAGKLGGLFAATAGCLKDSFYWDIKGNEDTEH